MVKEGYEEIVKSLKEVGLTEYEAKAYFFLVIYNVLPADELCKVSNISPSRIYDVLSSLEKISLVTVIPGKPKKYQAVQPTLALKSLITKKEEEIKSEFDSIIKVEKSITENLQKMLGVVKAPEKETFVGVIDGKAGVIRFSHALFRDTKKELLIFAGDMMWLKDELSNLKNLSDKKAVVKILGDITSKNKNYVEKAMKIGIEIKQKPKGLDLRSLVSDGRTLYISRKYKKSGFEELAKFGIKSSTFTEDYVALISHFRPLIESVRFYFNSIWNQSNL